MYILLKLDYAKFGVSNLFISKVIDEKPLGGGVGSTLLPSKRRVNVFTRSDFRNQQNSES